jgi:predicted outer membrane repeat protein
VSTTGDNSNDGSSWANAVRTIQRGIDLANAGFTVLAADGTYTGNGNKDLDFGGKAIHVKSENGSDVCVIDCENAGRGFYFHNSEGNTSIVEGFTIRNGDGSSYGGGVYCDSSSPGITNCTFDNNTAGYGGGICSWYGSMPQIDNCIFINNTAKNNGGGINCDQSDTLISNCVFKNNTAASRGGGVLCWNGSIPEIINCTIENNTSANDGGGIYCSTNSDPVFKNCIIWNNTASNSGNQCYIDDSGSSVTMSCCCYDNSAGHWGGNHEPDYSDLCIHADPQFAAGTLRLSAGSPCIDAGCNAYVTWSYDLDGNPRIFDNTVDIGAYETCIVTNTIGMKFRRIPAGSFTMGDIRGDSHFGERPTHTVNITKDFYIGVYEVTQAQWVAVMGSNPSYFSGDNNPVEQVDWNDIQTFIDGLNTLEGTTVYSLPTEAEWEYACRVGTSTKYCYGDAEGTLGDYAWYSSNPGNKTYPVGEKQPNIWGLYDMHGNVWEWCGDWYDSGYYQYCVDNSITDDPQGPASGTDRVLRGGSWCIGARYCRSAYRCWVVLDYTSYDVGFRLRRSFSAP